MCATERSRFAAAEIKLETLMREVIPQIIPLIAVLFLITYLPDLVLAVPRWLMPVR